MDYANLTASQMRGMTPAQMREAATQLRHLARNTSNGRAAEYSSQASALEVSAGIRDRVEAISPELETLEPMPRRADDLAFRDTDAAPAYTREARTALNEWARLGDGRRGHVPKSTYDILGSYAERTALTTVSDTGGGYLVTPDGSGGVTMRTPAASPLLNLVTMFSTTKDSVKRRRMKRHATYGSIYTSEFVGSWTGEIPSASAGQNEPSFGFWEAKISKYRAMARISNDELDDADFDLFALLSVVAYRMLSSRLSTRS